MNLSIGVDCERIARFEKVLSDPPLLERLFTPLEISYCQSKAEPTRHLAVRFAAKEAIIKAFHDQGPRIGFSDIEVRNRTDGLPRARVKGMERYHVKISLSHSGDMALAQALVYLDEAGVVQDGTDEQAVEGIGIEGVGADRSADGQEDPDEVGNDETGQDRGAGPETDR